MTYKIVITQVTREQVNSRVWKQVGEDEDGKPIYEYVDNEKTEDVTREVYTQRVDELDLVGVIKAVNNKEVK